MSSLSTTVGRFERLLPRTLKGRIGTIVVVLTLGAVAVFSSAGATSASGSPVFRPHETQFDGAGAVRVGSISGPGFQLYGFTRNPCQDAMIVMTVIYPTAGDTSNPTIHSTGAWEWSNREGNYVKYGPNSPRTEPQGFDINWAYPSGTTPSGLIIVTHLGHRQAYSSFPSGLTFSPGDPPWFVQVCANIIKQPNPAPGTVT